MAVEESQAPLRPMTAGAVMGAASRAHRGDHRPSYEIFVARLRGPDGKSGFAIELTIFMMLMVVCALGIEHGIAYSVTSGGWAAPDALRSAQRVALPCGAAGAALCLVARNRDRGDQRAVAPSAGARRGALPAGRGAQRQRRA
jgi:hypothetical protein